MVALVFLGLGYAVAIALIKRLQQLRANIRSGYGSDFKATVKLRGPWLVLALSSTILVDLNVLTPKPWYTVGAALFMVFATISLFRLYVRSSWLCCWCDTTMVAKED